MEDEQIEVIAKQGGTVFAELAIGLTPEIQTAIKEAEEQAEADGKSDYSITLTHSLKFNPVKLKVEHAVKVSVSYKSETTTTLPDPSQPELEIITDQ